MKQLLSSSERLRELDMARLVILYSLRYERHSNNDIVGLISDLERRGVSEKLRKVAVKNNVTRGELVFCLHTVFIFMCMYYVR